MSIGKITIRDLWQLALLALPGALIAEIGIWAVAPSAPPSPWIFQATGTTRPLDWAWVVLFAGLYSGVFGLSVLVRLLKRTTA